MTRHPTVPISGALHPTNGKHKEMAGRNTVAREQGKVPRIFRGTFRQPFLSQTNRLVSRLASIFFFLFTGSQVHQQWQSTGIRATEMGCFGPLTQAMKREHAQKLHILYSIVRSLAFGRYIVDPLIEGQLLTFFDSIWVGKDTAR